MKKFFEEIIYRLFVIVFWVLGSLPLSWSRRCGVFLGRICFVVARSQRRTAMDNLRIAFPDMVCSEKEKLTRKVFENLGQLAFEIFWSYKLAKDSLFKYFKIEGQENLDQAFAEGRGVLTLTAHFGNWEVMTAVGAMHGFPVSIIYRPFEFPPLERLVMKLRTRFGGRQISRDKAFRKIVRALEENSMVGLLFDQHASKKEGVFVNFFGRPSGTSKGLALLALKTEAPVVPLFLVREKEGFTAHYLPKVPLIKTGDRVRDVKLNTEQYNRVIEDMIRRYPDQWWWVDRRWRSSDLHYWSQQEELEIP